LANEVRTGALRGARVKTGVEGQDTRLANDRSKHISKGSFVNYYDDLGISSTAAGAKDIRQKESDYSTSIKDQQGKIDTANKEVQTQYAAGKSQINKAWDALPGYKEGVSTAWNANKKSLTPINVVRQDGKGGYTTEGTYYLPKSVAEKLAETKGVATSWGPKGEFYIDAKTSEGGRYIGEELHTELGQGQKDYYNTWYTQSAPVIAGQIKKAEGQIGSAESALESSYATGKGQIGAAQTTIDSAIYKHDSDWEKVRSDYQARKDTMAKIFTETKFEEAK